MASLLRLPQLLQSRVARRVAVAGGALAAVTAAAATAGASGAQHAPTPAPTPKDTGVVQTVPTPQQSNLLQAGGKTFRITSPLARADSFDERSVKTDDTAKPKPVVTSVVPLTTQKKIATQVFVSEVPQRKVPAAALAAAKKADAQAAKAGKTPAQAQAAVRAAVQSYVQTVANRGGLTQAELHRIAPAIPKSKLAAYTKYLNLALYDANINTLNRVADFLGNALEETDNFHTMTEYDSGAAYNWRSDLGNTHARDGQNYKGRGIFQLTGRRNYGIVGNMIHRNLVKNPKSVANADNAFLTAAAFVILNHMNGMADRGHVTQYCEVLNGGTNGIKVRYGDINHARSVLKSAHWHA